MRKLILPVLAAGVILLATAAVAAALSATGVIKNVNMKKDSITLMDNNVYILAEGFEAETFKAGENVTIVYSLKNGKMIASSVKATK